MVTPKEKKEIQHDLLELGIEIRVLPIKNVETDLLAINEQGKENLEAIVKWEHLKKKLEKVI